MIETIAEAILSSKTKFKDDLGCPDKPGLYAFVLREKGDLGEYGKPGQVIYVGSAPDSLAKGNWNADLKEGKTGGINVIDLANINSCSFIATQDLGKKNPNNSFEVLGRFDNSDIRGCNLMVL